MKPSDLLTSATIALDNNATSKKRVLEAAAGLLAAVIPETDEESVFERLLERERLGSTGIGHSVALPHARIDGLTTAYGAFIRLTESVDYDAIDGAPVDLIYALVVPRDATDEHLKILASLAQLFSQRALCNALREASSMVEVVSIMDPDTPVTTE
jgi:nitrogen PTS system EIIA component